MKHQYKKRQTLKNQYAKKAALSRGNVKSCKTKKYQAVYGRGMTRSSRRLFL